jgi:hypothetical protein
VSVFFARGLSHKNRVELAFFVSLFPRRLVCSLALKKKDCAMTINVQNDIVTLQHASSDHWSITDEAEHLKFRKKEYEVDEEDTATTVSNSSKDTDDDSVLSTQSSFPTSRVTFSKDLVTVEWTRPYTSPEDIPHLYYSTEETNRYVTVGPEASFVNFSTFATCCVEESLYLFI